MTCAELLDTLLEHRLRMIVDVQPEKPEVRIILEATIGLKRFVSQQFIHKEHLMEHEDQLHKEHVFEKTFESLLEPFL